MLWEPMTELYFFGIKHFFFVSGQEEIKSNNVKGEA